MFQLFREEAVQHQWQRLYGEVTLASPSSSWAISLVIALLVSRMIIGLIFGHYARKETVVGWLTPDKGLIRFYASQPGVVEKVHVKEGENFRPARRS